MSGGEADVEMHQEGGFEGDELLTAIERLGYQPLPSEEAWSNAICADSTEDSQLPDLLISVCAYLVNTLCDACKIPHAKITSSDVDSASFSLELRSFLSDYGAPFPPGFDLLERPSRKRVLVNFLVAEVEACRLIKRRSPEFNLLVPGTNQTANQPMFLMRAESGGEQNRAGSERARALRLAAIALGLPKPTSITCAQLFDKFENRIKELFGKFDETARTALMGRPLLTVRLSDRQASAVARLVSLMNKEYDCRRAVLLKRFELTVSAFSWSEVVEKSKKEKNNDPIAAVVTENRSKLIAVVPIGIANILAARDDVLKVEKTSSEGTRARTELNRVLMGIVPDRGGRAWEVDPPERESFTKQQRTRNQPRGGAGRGNFASARPANRGGQGRPQQYQQQSYDRGQSAAAYANPYADPQYAYAQQFQQQQQQPNYDNPYYGQAYDGPGLDQGNYGRGGSGRRGGRGHSRVQRGRHY